MTLKILSAAAMFAVIAACGQARAQQEAPTPGPKLIFVFCPQASPSYLLAEAARDGCRELLAGRDYADGRVIIGVRDGTPDADLQRALAAYRASVLTSGPVPGQLLLQVPAGTVPQAVAGLARYPFVTFAQPDLLQHPDQSAT